MALFVRGKNPIFLFCFLFYQAEVIKYAMFQNNYFWNDKSFI